MRIFLICPHSSAKPYRIQSRITQKLLRNLIYHSSNHQSCLRQLIPYSLRSFRYTVLNSFKFYLLRNIHCRFRSHGSAPRGTTQTWTLPWPSSFAVCSPINQLVTLLIATGCPVKFSGIVVSLFQLCNACSMTFKTEYMSQTHSGFAYLTRALSVFRDLTITHTPESSRIQQRCSLKEVQTNISM